MGEYPSPSIHDFHVGQEGSFMIYDAFHRPLDTVDGTILQLMEGQGALYAMIKTDSGVRPGRLCRV